jgi:D-cysteine desulfhydrase
VRKLEFLLAEALQRGCDSTVTIGGVQSNHCRATAVASRQLGLEPYLILRTDDPSSIDLTGIVAIVGISLCIASVIVDTCRRQQR